MVSHSTGCPGTRMLKFHPGLIAAAACVPPLMLPKSSSFMRVVLLVLCAFHVQISTSAPAGPAPAAKAHPKSSKSTFVPRTTVIWRGDIVSARGFTNDLIAAYRTEQQGLL
ncbi:MAG: hypothetical protein WAS23_13925, partial [Dokdonella sp.]